MNEEDNALWRGFEARLERLEDIVRDLDESLRGDRRRKIIGLLAEWDRHDAELRRLNALILGDAAGSKGMAHDWDILMGRRSGEERRIEFRWKYWIPTLLALLAMAVTILTNLDKIKQNLPKYHPNPLEKKIEKAKHPKGKKIIRYRLVPPPEETLSEPVTDTPDINQK